MCGTKFRDRIANILWPKLGTDLMKMVTKRGRLRWWGHVESREELD
jgi:hypothetical protein